MKKICILALCAILVVGIISGCGTQKTESKSSEAAASSSVGGNVKISFWKSPHSSREEEIWKGIIGRFNEKYPNVSVEFLSVPWDSVNQKEMAAFASNTPPDVSFQVEQYPVYAEKGKLVDLNQYMTEDAKKNYPQSALDYCTYNGKLMGRPFIALNSVMFYNKDIFEKEGIQIPKTWDEMVSVAQKCTKDTNGDGKVDQYGMLLIDKPSIDQWNAVTYIMQAGGNLWNSKLTNIGFNNEAGVKGLQFYTDLYNKYKVCPPIDTFSSQEEEENAFYTGKVAMMPAQIQFSGNIRTSAPKMNFGAFLLPAGPASDIAHSQWSFANIGMLSIASDSKYIKEAWDFVDFATKPEVEKDYLSQVGFFSPQLATNDLMYQDNEVMKVAAEGIKNLQVSPATKNFQGMFDGLKTMFESCVRGTATPKQAIQDLEDKLNALSK